MEKHYSIWNNIVYFFRFYKRQEPAVLVMRGLEIIIGTLLPFFEILLPKMAVDLVMQGEGTWQAAGKLGLSVLFLMVFYGAYHGLKNGSYFLYNKQRDHLMGMLFLKSLRIPYQYVESGEVKRAYWKAYDANAAGNWAASTRILEGTVSLIRNIFCFLLYSTILGNLNPLILVFLIFVSVANYQIGIKQVKYMESKREEQAVADRHFYCVQSAMGNVKAAKDVRIYAMNSWLLRLRDQVLAEIKTLNQKLHARIARHENQTAALRATRDIVAYGFLIYQMALQTITAGEFVLYFGAITGFSEFVISIMDCFSNIRSGSNSANYLRSYLELPEESRDRKEEGESFRKIREYHGEIRKLHSVQFEFRDVSFSYPSGKGASPVKIFDHFNLTVHAGEKIALVGVNGAGKSTFVKLLCGMYEPDDGQILINGIDQREFSKEERYALFSAVFQEPVIFPFTVGENIAMDIAENVDEKKAWEALEKAGLKEVFQKKNITMDSWMLKNMTEQGIELSGGEQQRFLLARALYKDAPVLVLDEPTAALDAIAESEVYESYNRQSNGKTAIFISHRLASTRFSDRIILLADGRVVESGTHGELMKKDGEYARMFQLQSRYYNE